MFSAITLLAAAVSPSADQVHHTQIELQGRPVAISYRAETDVSTRQIGMAAGTRMSSERCLWKARVGVVREVGGEGAALINQRLDADKAWSGSRHGSCTLAKRQVARDLARRDDDIRAHLADVAARDRSQLAVDLAAIQKLAVN